MAEITYEEAMQGLSEAQHYLAVAKRDVRRNWGDFWFLTISVGLGFLLGEWIFMYFKSDHALLMNWMRSYTNIYGDYENLYVASGLSSQVFLVLLCMLLCGLFSTYLWAIWSGMKNWGLFRDNNLLDNITQQYKVDHYYGGVYTGTTFERAGCIVGFVSTVLTPVVRFLSPVIMGLIFIIPLFVYRTFRVLFRLISKHVALNKAKDTVKTVENYIKRMPKMQQNHSSAEPNSAPLPAPVYNGVPDGRYYTYIPPKQ